jgi:hypothetical protein
MMKKELKNPGPIEFTAPIIGSGVGAYVEFPFDTAELFGTIGRIPVVVEFDGVPYQGTMLRYGTEMHIIIVVKKVREAIGKQAPDTVHVKVKLDEGKREVILPEDVQLVFETNSAAFEQFQQLSFTHQKEYMVNIEDAKRPETRQRRIETMIQTLLEKN